MTRATVLGRGKKGTRVLKERRRQDSNQKRVACGALGRWQDNKVRPIVRLPGHRSYNFKGVINIPPLLHHVPASWGMVLPDAVVMVCCLPSSYRASHSQSETSKATRQS